MARHYDSNPPRLRFAAPYTKFGVGGAALALLALIPFLLAWVALHIPPNYFISDSTLRLVAFRLEMAGALALCVGCAIMVASIFTFALLPDKSRVRHLIRRGLCDPAYGNPLNLKDGELLPTVTCEEVDKGLYDIKVTAISKSVDDLLKICSFLSGYLRGRFGNLAIIEKVLSPSCNYVTYRVDDVLADKSLVYHSVEKMRPLKRTAPQNAKRYGG